MHRDIWTETDVHRQRQGTETGCGREHLQRYKYINTEQQCTYTEIYEMRCKYTETHTDIRNSK